MPDLRERWESTRWWRAVRPDGTVVCETSDEADARRYARPGDQIQQLWARMEQEWRDA